MAALSGGLAGIAKLAAISVLLVLPALAQAQESSDRQDQQNQQQATREKTKKEPPPPLFSRHRRGIYKNALGVAVVDATPQSPPLEIDDPGVPDKGEYEINLTTQADLSKRIKDFDLLLIDANYGMLPKVLGHDLPTQLKVEFTVAGAKINGQPFAAGVGALRVGLKFNFYNNER